MNPEKRPLVIAHRGASSDFPENSLEAFSGAFEQGADWIELDVRRSKDGVLVVHHDAHLSDGRLIRDLDSNLLPEEVPSLAEAFEASENMGVNVEIKHLPGEPDFEEVDIIGITPTEPNEQWRTYGVKDFKSEYEWSREHLEWRRIEDNEV